MSTIVTGFTNDLEGRKALDLAIEESQLRGAKLVVVHSMKAAPASEVVEYRRVLEAIEGRLKAGGVESEVLEYARGDSPADDILAAADDFDADLIVIGYRRRTSAGKALLGSHAQDIMMGATCPVLATIAD